MKNNQAPTLAPRPGLGGQPTAGTRWRVARLSSARARILAVLTDQPEPGTREHAGLASAPAAQIARSSRHPLVDSVEAGRERS